jgi:transcriptional accessory protein Tex/SPT6
VSLTAPAVVVAVVLQDGTTFGASTASDVQQMGNNVFRNAAPFLRVRRGEVAALQNEEEFDALDDARIHPENEALLQVSTTT